MLDPTETWTYTVLGVAQTGAYNNTGTVTGNDTAVQRLAEQPVPGLTMAPIHDALAVRLGVLPDEALDPHRAILDQQHRALIGWLDGLADRPNIPHDARPKERSR